MDRISCNRREVKRENKARGARDAMRERPGTPSAFRRCCEEGVGGGETLENSGAADEVVPGNEASVSGEVPVPGSEVVFSAGGDEFEMDWAF